MSKIEGSWIWFLLLIRSTVIQHLDMRITGRFKGYFLSVHMANLSAIGNSSRVNVLVHRDSKG